MVEGTQKRSASYAEIASSGTPQTAVSSCAVNVFPGTTSHSNTVRLEQSSSREHHPGEQLTTSDSTLHKTANDPTVIDVGEYHEALRHFEHAQYCYRAEAKEHDRTKLQLDATDTKLAKTEAAWHLEVNKHVGTKDRLRVIRSRLHRAEADLEAEKQMREHTNGQLHQKQQELDKVFKCWRESASQLDRILSQGQGYNLATDDELIQKATTLRYNIRSFAIEFFGDEVKNVKVSETTSESINRYLQITPCSVAAYIQSESFRPAIVRAFLWQYLRFNIFEAFSWAPESASEFMSGLRWFLSTSKPIE
jgi:hypothetical protein